MRWSVSPPLSSTWTPAEKIILGDWIAPRVATPGPWAWALGRVGARVPLYGSVHKTVDPDKASEWLNLLLDAHHATSKARSSRSSNSPA